MPSAVAGGASTISKYPVVHPANFPQTLTRARGAEVWGSDGKRYTDWISSLLAVILGHNHPEVTEAVVRHLRRDGGPAWSLVHALEEEVAETILRLTGFTTGRVRFFKTGSEACTAAMRIARATTGCNAVVSSGYHGWHDTALTAPPAWGVPQVLRTLTHVVPFGDLIRMRSLFPWLAADNQEDYTFPAHDIAAVMIEPEMLEPPPDGYLAGLRALCDRYGALLILDECITGGRYPEFTAARHYGVTPDLLVLSKCLANGFPLACVVGDENTMACFDADWQKGMPVYCSGTYSGETASLAAAQATLRVWEREHVAEHLQRIGLRLWTALAAAARQGFAIQGPVYRTCLAAPTLEAKTAVAAYLADHGHLIGTGWNLSAAHDEADVDAVAGAFADAVNVVKAGYDGGRPAVQLYRQ